jgi:hypothetical protein
MDGSSMSKSKGNLVELQQQLADHGVDVVRVTMLFAGPPEDDKDWARCRRPASASGWPGCGGWPGEVGGADDAGPTGDDEALRRVTHQTDRRGDQAARADPLQRRDRAADVAVQRRAVRRSTPTARVRRPRGRRPRRWP